jgi:Conserved protein/domain typically associated with flavoprotein oxygenases, DIM6/NTAB family
MNKKMIDKLNVSPIPEPAVLVTAAAEGKAPNVFTVAWTGLLSHNPNVVYIAVNPARYSNAIIRESMEYVINIPTENIAKAVDYCGIVSGRNENKFIKTGLKQIPASVVKAPLIQECPLNIECKVLDILKFGSHDIFVGEIVAIHCNEDCLNENGGFKFEEIRPFGYTLGEYRAMGEKIGFTGYSKKPDTML